MSQAEIIKAREDAERFLRIIAIYSRLNRWGKLCFWVDLWSTIYYNRARRLVKSVPVRWAIWQAEHIA